MSDITFTIPKLLYAMTSHVGRMPGRYRANDVLFAHRYNVDRDRSALVATDNSRLAILEWPAEINLADPFDALIPTPSIKNLRAPRARDPLYRVTIRSRDGVGPMVVGLARGGASAECEQRDSCGFPPFREIIPRYAEKPRQPITSYFALRPKFVSDAMRLHSTFARLCGKPGDAYPNVTFWNNGWRKVVMTESFCDDMRLRVLIMPAKPYDLEAIEARAAECEAEAAAA